MNSRSAPLCLLLPVLLATATWGQDGKRPEPVPAKPAAPASTAPAPLELPDTYDKNLNRDGFSFKVTWPADGKPDVVKITPSGLSRDNSDITRHISGAVTGASVDDLDGDNSPEIYIFVKTAEGKGSLAAFAVDQGRSLMEIHIRTPAEDGVAGYRGGDDFRISEGRLVRTFPVYNEADKNGSPTGGRRQITYKLVPSGDHRLLIRELVVDI